MREEAYVVCYKANSFGGPICDMWYIDFDLTPLEEMRAEGPSDCVWMVPGTYGECE